MGFIEVCTEYRSMIYKSEQKLLLQTNFPIKQQFNFNVWIQSCFQTDSTLIVNDRIDIMLYSMMIITDS